MKNLLKINGSKPLSKIEKKAIHGGFVINCNSDNDCALPDVPNCIFACIVNFGVCVYDIPSCTPGGIG